VAAAGVFTRAPPGAAEGRLLTSLRTGRAGVPTTRTMNCLQESLDGRYQCTLLTVHAQMPGIGHIPVQPGWRFDVVTGVSKAPRFS
jgi:hypothetical protein